MTPEVVELLQRTKAAVLANPDHFDMGYWYATTEGMEWTEDEDGVIDLAGIDTVPSVPLIAMLDQCGTVACAAGWIVALSGEKVNPGEPIMWEAERLIGHAGEHHCSLFHLSEWPHRLMVSYEYATSKAARARAFSRAVDLWIELDGDPVAFSAA